MSSRTVGRGMVCIVIVALVAGAPVFGLAGPTAAPHAAGSAGVPGTAKQAPVAAVPDGNVGPPVPSVEASPGAGGPAVLVGGSLAETETRVELTNHEPNGTSTHHWFVPLDGETLSVDTVVLDYSDTGADLSEVGPRHIVVRYDADGDGEIEERPIGERGSRTVRDGGQVLELSLPLAVDVEPKGEEPPELVVMNVTNPDAPGNYTATVRLERGGSTVKAGTASFEIGGEAPALATSADALEFGVIDANGSESRSVTLRNDGGRSLEVRSTTVVGADADAVAVENGGSFTLESDERQTLSLTVTPAAAGDGDGDGALDARLQIESNDPTQRLTTIPLRIDAIVARRWSYQDGETVLTVAAERARPNTTITVDPSSIADDGPVRFEELSVTAAGAEDYELSIAGGPAVDERTPAFDRDDGTIGLTTIELEHSLAEESVRNASFTFAVDAQRLESADAAPGDVALYRHHDGTWNEVPTTVLNGTETIHRFRANASGLSAFVVGLKQPSFAVVTASANETTIRPGERLDVRAEISNEGGSNGTHAVALRLDDTVLQRENVSLAAGEGTRITFDPVVERTGTYTVWVDDVRVDTVTVVAATDPPGEGALDGGMLAVGGLAVAGAAVLAIGFTVLRRRRP